MSDEATAGVGCPLSPASPGLLFLFLIAANKAAPRPLLPRPAGDGDLPPPDAPPSICVECIQFSAKTKIMSHHMAKNLEKLFQYYILYPHLYIC